MKAPSIAIVVFGEPGSLRNALLEEKYANLAIHLKGAQFLVDSIVYNDAIAEQLEITLCKYEVVLVWVNPIEQGNDRRKLDALLTSLSAQGCFVSTHPDTILKMGTKEILYRIRETDFGGDIQLYNSFEIFKTKAPFSFSKGLRILKQYRGNGGNGVFKIDASNIKKDRITVVHAQEGSEEIEFTVDSFFAKFEPYFQDNGLLIDQEWNPNIVNGMVRCYLCGPKVAGFGYQEVNALYPISETNSVFKPPSRRFYFSEDCGLFQDLRKIMESSWVGQIQELAHVDTNLLPVIWDADFFINKVNSEIVSNKYSLCEINVSCVSPFPESSIPHIVQAITGRIR